MRQGRSRPYYSVLLIIYDITLGNVVLMHTRSAGKNAHSQDEGQVRIFVHGRSLTRCISGISLWLYSKKAKQ
jgi:hypothetical protein